MQKIIFMLLIIVISLNISSCDNSDNGIDTKTLEKLYNENQTMFVGVKDMVKSKLIGLKAKYISIEKNKNDNQDRIYLEFDSNESKNYKEITDVFSKDEAEKIENIFKFGFIYIEASKEWCSFAEQGLLDCHNEIRFTTKPKELEEYAAKDDDEIVKKFNDNWFIYGVR